jgi:hypothetical protein
VTVSAGRTQRLATPPTPGSMSSLNGGTGQPAPDQVLPTPAHRVTGQSDPPLRTRSLQPHVGVGKPVLNARVGQVVESAPEGFARCSLPIGPRAIPRGTQPLCRITKRGAFRGIGRGDDSIYRGRDFLLRKVRRKTPCHHTKQITGGLTG